MNKPKVYWIDLFAGFGGTSQGIKSSNVNAKVIACVNHDPIALSCHELNHSDCEHFEEDIRDWKVIMKIKRIVDKLRAKDPTCKINIWASLECTHFSKAKGGMSREEDSRTLGNHLYYYIKVLDPDFVYVENVGEFLTWGPLDDEGIAIPELKGVDYDRWVVSMKFLGYKYDYRMLDAADFGSYTSRERYFGVFAKNEYEITFPEPTHAKKNKLKPGLEQWKAVKEVLDFSLSGNSIFGLNKKNKPYVDNTMERIYKGLLKFEKQGLFDPVFITSYYGNGNAHSIQDPCNTLTTKDRFAVHFIHSQYGNATNNSVDEPSGTITQNHKQNLVEAKFTMDFQFDNTGRTIDRPAQTLIARMDKAPVYLIESKPGDIDFVDPYSTPIREKIREFMIKHGIADITIRPLSIPELMAIQGFPADYILTGKKEDQLKFIGNSVVPLMAKMLVEANYYSFIKEKAA